MGLEPMMVDLNRLDSINEKTIKEVKFCLIQHSRQRIDDRYNLEETIKRLKKMNKNLYILVDDNYVVMKVEKIGIQSGGDISAFSLFKLLGPEGIGCIIGDRKSIKNKIHELFWR